MKKSQTATEYLIILAVVIVIALVVVNTMGGFPGIGAGSGKKVSDLKLATDTVGIESYSIGTDSSLFKLKNNYYDTITVTSFRVNNQSNLTCNSSNTNPALPIVLNVGQSMLINCTVVNTSTYTLSSRQTPMVGVTYTDDMGATRSAGNEGSAVATSNSQEEEVSPPVTPSYTITFNSNNGTGSMSTQTIQENASANLTANNFTRTNYTFNGWNTLANGSGSNYSDNVSYTMGSGNVTLYAKWTAADACGTPGDATDPDCWSAVQGSMNWTAAGAACAALGDGWRLPTIEELTAGLTAQFITSPPTVTGFADLTVYWSSTESSEDPDGYAWYAYYGYGAVSSSDGGKLNDNSVRCVR